MPELFVPNVPELEPLVAHARQQADWRVDPPAAGYVRIHSHSDMVIRRSDTGLVEAVWYGCLVGGYIGRVRRFDGETLHIANATSDTG